MGLPHHRNRDGGLIWYGGGKLAADLTLPKLRTRWASPGADEALGDGLSAPAARGVLRQAVTRAADAATSEAEFFARLRAAGVEVWQRFSDVVPGQVTGYAVTFPGHVGRDGAPVWYGGGRLSAGLTLPQLRNRCGSREWMRSARSGSGSGRRRRAGHRRHAPRCRPRKRAVRTRRPPALTQGRRANAAATPVAVPQRAGPGRPAPPGDG